MSTSTSDPTASDRAARFAEATSLLPADADLEHVMRLADWLDGSTVLLDPERLRAAARARAAQEYDAAGNPRSYDHLPPSRQAVYDGEAAQIVSAYLSTQ